MGRPGQEERPERGIKASEGSDIRVEERKRCRQREQSVQRPGGRKRQGEVEQLKGSQWGVGCRDMKSRLGRAGSCRVQVAILWKQDCILGTQGAIEGFHQRRDMI